MPKSSRKITSPKGPLLLVCLVLLLFGGLYLAVHLFSSGRQGPQAVIEEAQQPEAKAMRPQQSMSETGDQPQPAASAPPETKSPQENSEEAAPDPSKECPVLDQELTSLFHYLDEQPYIQDYQFQGGILPHLREILQKLFSHPPLINVSSTDLLGKMKNMAHFYRVLGPKDIFLAKDYLANEQGRIENDLDVFYQWVLLESCRRQHTTADLSLPLPALYKYAAYFLTSSGGKSYLFRRREHVALLVQYYCILLIDQANKVGLNHYGIDLAPYIDSCLSRIQQSTSLQNRAAYLQTLQQLHLKYAAASGKKPR